MFKKYLLIGIVTSIAAAPAFAEGASKEESAGVGIGAVIGGVAGGPVGAIVGAAFGAKLGDEFHQRNTQLDSLSASLDGSQAQVARLERDIGALQGRVRTKEGELKAARELAKPELASLLQAGIEMDLLFRTDEHVLADATGARLQQLAGSLAANPDIRIRLDGFADERGDAEYNRDLSVRRARHVHDLLVSAGVPAGRITVNAHGESQAEEQNPDSFALERRVSMTLYTGETPSFAANPR